MSSLGLTLLSIVVVILLISFWRQVLGVLVIVFFTLTFVGAFTLIEAVRM